MHDLLLHNKKIAYKGRGYLLTMIPPDQEQRAQDHQDIDLSTKNRTTRKVSRRQFLKGIFGGLLTLPLLSGAYGRWIEPQWLLRRKMTMVSTTLPQSFRGIRIAHITDIHYGMTIDDDGIRKIVREVMAEKPDLICYTGDLVEDGRLRATSIIPMLQQLRAPLGQYAVLGNHDYERGQDLVTSDLRAAGFEVLTNRSVLITRGTESIAVAGIDDVLDGEPDMTAAMQQIPEGTWCILLAHEPDWADEAVLAPVDVQLSGHSHGGQVRFPFVGALSLPFWGQKYPDGYYRFERASLTGRPLQLHTSRGIGTTFLPIRFMCPPEWTLITITDR